jgi:hypothetical protein
VNTHHNEGRVTNTIFPETTSEISALEIGVVAHTLNLSYLGNGDRRISSLRLN